MHCTLYLWINKFICTCSVMYIPHRSQAVNFDVHQAIEHTKVCSQLLKTGECTFTTYFGECLAIVHGSTKAYIETQGSVIPTPVVS